MAQEGKRYRILVGKPGLDGHDRGAKCIARALRDNGFEVVYTGIRRTAEEIAVAAIQEDVDAIGLSSLSGAHLQLFPEVIQYLKKHDAADIPVIGGGIIPEEDIPVLREHGVQAVFTPGTSMDEIITTFRDLCN